MARASGWVGPNPGNGKPNGPTHTYSADGHSYRPMTGRGRKHAQPGTYLRVGHADQIRCGGHTACQALGTRTHNDGNETMIEYTITARQGNTTVDAEESREYGHARRVFEARCEQWEGAGERTRLTLADSDGHVISARTVN